MEEKSMTYIKQHGAALAVQSNADNLALNLNIQSLLELQGKYTTLRCECKRFADYVMNLTRSRDAMSIQFDDEYLGMAGDMLFKFFGCLPKTDLEGIIKKLKK